MIDSISKMLVEFLKDEQTFASAEQLYSESFRSPKAFRVADGFYGRDELVEYLMTPIYDANDWSPDPAIVRTGLTQQQAESMVDGLEFVELCNYKGEGEGFELLARVSHLRVFHGKYDYK